MLVLSMATQIKKHQNPEYFKKRYLLSNKTIIVVEFEHKQHIQGYIEEQPEYSVYLPKSYIIKRLADAYIQPTRDPWSY